MQVERVFIALATSDLEQLVTFYQQLLGQPPQVWRPEAYAEFRWPQLTLALFCPQVAQVYEFAQAQPGGVSLCLQVADLEAAIAHFCKLGYPPPQPVITATHGREVYAYDPEGHRLILYQPLI